MKIKLILSILLVTMLAWGCGNDSASDDDSNSEPTGPSNQLNANVMGGSQSGDVSGSSEMSAPSENYATVASSELTVFLTSAESGVISFTLDTSTAEVPSSYMVNRGLDGPAYLTWTSPSGIFEGGSGSIQLDTCPNDPGAVVTGRFNGIQLINSITEAPDGELNGTFTTRIIQSDGSALCAQTSTPADPEGMMSTEEASPGPQCPNSDCDGACCRFLPTLETCITGCITTGNPLDFMALITCITDCEAPLLMDSSCGPAYRGLGMCAQQNMCESGLDDNECIATNCCEEYKVAF